MGHVFQVPDDLYERLAAYAAQRGQTADELLLTYVKSVVGQADVKGATGKTVGADDPLAPFIGAFVFGVGDLAENHDHYLAQAYADEYDHNE